MIINYNTGVDFGLWKKISPSLQSCPLDVHSVNLARKLGLLHRKQMIPKLLMNCISPYEKWILMILLNMILLYSA